jgi:hypothetical protein
METLRRATLYGAKDHDQVRALLARLAERVKAAEESTKPSASALFDYGYFLSSLYQVPHPLGTSNCAIIAADITLPCSSPPSVCDAPARGGAFADERRVGGSDGAGRVRSNAQPVPSGSATHASPLQMTYTGLHCATGGTIAAHQQAAKVGARLYYVRGDIRRR